VGCQRCNGTGYYGRIGVYEIMEITPTLRGYIARKAPTDALREAAIAEGMLTLKQSVRRLVLDGTTTLSEMHAISTEDFDNANILSHTGEDYI
jgi:type IV pilus assembly protein PilB